MKPGDEQRQYVEQILAATERAASLTKSLLAFSRKQAMELRPVDINEMVNGIQKMMVRLIGEDIEFTVACAPDVLTVQSDAGQLEQVLMNLDHELPATPCPSGGKLIDHRPQNIRGRGRPG